jgi:protein-S-isoprenylcysteine O-methyltransferase Ste14
VLGSLIDANWLRWSTFSEKWVLLLYLGVPFLLVGAAARVLARWTLGKSFSHVVQTSGSHQLVTTGIYGLVRHPAYLGTLCLLIGFPLCFGSWLGLGIALLLGFPAQVYRIRVEEQALRDWFGEAYEEYCRRTKRLVPYVW